MPLLRLLFAGFVALFAMLAVAFTAAVVIFAGLLGWVTQLFRGKPRPVRSGPAAASGRRTRMPAGEVIDVEATKVPDEPGGR
ncbi:hypothetical protein Verru16b_00517 [Lacunisphaera limnophila]|uniref:Uncharacterized protein n=1 Tax=Lacunisphaera limnophila TaxID=1838286 RepID=A0A1D8ARG8_9BACT|nr:hypothetical protein [Lacunisphaera limnophila]AOS43472.1 hypothetical protein Verru16b_00517 [Lacunisphaera limnophila]